MKFVIVLSLLVVAALPMFAQSDLSKLVDTERSFAKAAVDKNTRDAFLEFMSSDAVVFVPERTLAKPYWTGRTVSASALIWAPNFADISANGILGYTTGNWEYRAKGRDDQPSAFGDFVTVWLRQPSGQYRWVVDIGIGHDKPEKYSEEFTAPSETSSGNPRSLSAADSANRFFEAVYKQGIQKAYSGFADENVRFFRENELPGIGKGRLISRVKKDKGTFTIPKRMVFFESDDIAYVTNKYSFAPEKGDPATGNFLQIWKFTGGQWKIVLDIFKAVPAKP
jgi:ketosteroid isomerase-like protein